jgi:uncharacterized membrane protein YhaH (DUF805 family)
MNWKGLAGSAPGRGDFIDGLNKGVTRMFDFKGRMKRAPFWWFCLVGLLLLVGLLANIRPDPANPDPAAMMGEWLASTLIVSFPVTTAAMRRLHDTGRKGWWVWVAPAAGPILGAALPWPMGLMAHVGVLVAIGWFLAQPGEPGPNAYGPPP